MKHQLKISGKKVSVPEVGKELMSAWKFECRPGGWVIGVSPEGKRVRFSYNKIQKQFFTKISGAFNANEFFGEKIEQARAGQSSQGASDLTAQFPGKVRKILVKEGASVVAGSPLLMVEAMKMEFAVKAPSNGKVKKILVMEGQVLVPGQLLVDFEENAS